MKLAAACSVRLIAKDMLVHYSTVDWCICSKDHSIYRYSYHTRQFDFIFRIPPKNSDIFGRLKDFIARSSIKQKFVKSPGIWNLTMLEQSGDMVVIYDQIYIFKSAQADKLAQVIPIDPSIRDFAQPLRGGCALHENSQHLYFGEYLNEDHQNIRVIRVDTQLNKVEVCHQFSRSEIKHIHAIRYDKFRNRLWITTGDTNEESAFYYTDDEFLTVYKFAGGDQTWRAVTLFFDADGMEWGMDAGKGVKATDINKIFRFNFNTQQRHEMAVIGNPAYFSSQSSDGSVFVATSYEPGCLQPTPRQVGLWHRDTKANWQQLLAIDFEDQHQIGTGKFGLLLIPQGIGPAGTLLFTPINVNTGHFALYELSITRH